MFSSMLYFALWMAIICQPKSIINVEVGTNVDVDVAIGLTEKHYEWESLHTV